MKVKCPYHDDINPSMHLYGDNGFCFVCKVSVPVSCLNLHEYTPTPKPEPTNIPSMIKYIKGLQSKTVRGLQLPYNLRGYYIVWPSENYYKLRLWEGNTRYIAPAGTKPPLFSYNGTSDHLVVVEGELNAISLHLVAYGDYRICSPGAASNFMMYVKYYSQFPKITIIADHDGPGVVFGCSLREHLLKLGKKVNLVTLKKDFNQILQDGGEEAVKSEFDKEMA